MNFEQDTAAQFAFWLRFWRWVLAALEVIGGVCGIYAVAFGRTFGSARVILLLAFVFYLASLWGGILLALNRRRGVVASLIVQAFQLFQVSASGLLYSFVSGLQIIVGYRLVDDGFQFVYGCFFPARFLLFLNSTNWTVPGGAYTGINIAALLSIICLLYVRAAQQRSAPLPAHKQGRLH